MFYLGIFLIVMITLAIFGGIGASVEKNEKITQAAEGMSVDEALSLLKKVCMKSPNEDLARALSEIPKIRHKLETEMHRRVMVFKPVIDDLEQERR